jgi:hypothetical protein
LCILLSKQQCCHLWIGDEFMDTPPCCVRVLNSSISSQKASSIGPSQGALIAAGTNMLSFPESVPNILTTYSGYPTSTCLAAGMPANDCRQSITSCTLPQPSGGQNGNDFHTRRPFPRLYFWRSSQLEIAHPFEQSFDEAVDIVKIRHVFFDRG